MICVNGKNRLLDLYFVNSFLGRFVSNYRDKNRAIFSGELFSGEELLPENSLLGQ